MIKRYKLVAAIIIVLPLVLAVGVHAKAKPPATPKPGSSFAKRLDQRKTERQIKLVKEDKQRLIDVCRSVQTAIRVLQTSTSTIVDNRLAVYKRIDAKLWVMVGQIKLANKDTFKLERNKTIYDKKLALFKTTTDNYQQALDDMTIVNCKADAVGFQALLDTSRLYYDQIRAQVKDIRQYTVNTVKPTLSDYSNQLQPTNNGGQ